MPGTICLLPQELARNTHTRTHTKHIHTLRLQMTMHTAKEKQHTCTTTNLMPIATRPRNLQQCLETQLYAKHNHWPPFANYWHSIATQQCIILPMRECVPTARLQHDTLQCTTTLDNQYTPLGAHAGLTGHRRARRVVLATVSLHMARARTCKEGSKVPAASCCEPGTILNSRRARGDSEVLWFTTRLQTQPPKSPPVNINIIGRQSRETIHTSQHHRKTRPRNHMHVDIISSKDEIKNHTTSPNMQKSTSIPSRYAGRLDTTRHLGGHDQWKFPFCALGQAVPQPPGMHANITNANHQLISTTTGACNETICAAPTATEIRLLPSNSTDSKAKCVNWLGAMPICTMRWQHKQHTARIHKCTAKE